MVATLKGKAWMRLAMLGSLVGVRCIAQVPQAKLDAGMVEGSVSNGVASFKGIPYAAAPLGALRWRAPQPVKPWSGVKKVITYAADCMQVPFPSDAAPLGTTPAEDCLYVNVWEPAGTAPGAKLPVLVWIFGGGSVNGGASPEVYSGESFAKQGLMVVSFNYRIARFGFFAHPALTAANADGGLLGNYGYMDQIEAMKWLHRNAAALGGDPGNVTVFGESAGGRSVHMLLGTSLANGLFERAIIDSAGGRNGGQSRVSGAMAHGAPSGESIGLKFAESIGVPGTGADALAKLRALPAEAIRGDLNMATSRTNYYSGYMVDGKLILSGQEEPWAEGATQNVPLIIMTNSGDAGSAPGDSIDALFAGFGRDADKARAAYMKDGTKSLAELKGEVGRDRTHLEPSRFVASMNTLRGNPTYVGRFSYVATSLRSQRKLVPHATELPFVFDTVKAKYGAATTDKDEAAAHAVLTYYANFAKTGDPNGSGLPAWPKFDPAADVLMNFTMDDGPVAMKDPFHDRLDATELFDTRVPSAPYVEPVVPTKKP
jgi:para-nitrobenzyl esterase